ncbi:MAG: hypothetical protein HFJ41_08905 [Clostridia bacterium]|nr:hypothetical protein [Clostridia bacterium]
MLKDREYCAAPPLGELTAAIHINVAEIPDHARDDLAAATLDFVRGILRQPGGRAALDTKIKAKKAAI